MPFTQSMNLISPSGYAMPFELDESQPLVISLDYGNQIHPETGKEFFHHGVDFQVGSHTWLKALASGVVTGLSSDVKRGFNITVCYKNYTTGATSAYEVVYSHITQVLCQYGVNVKAGENIAQCNGLLHIEVRFNGEEIDPKEFLVMVRDNLLVENQTQMKGDNPEIAALDMDIHTPYDSDRPEIEMLMNRYIRSYFTDLLSGEYHVPSHTEQELRQTLQSAAQHGAYYEHAPSLLNPLGLGMRCRSFIEHIQTVLISDILDYLAFRHGVFLSSMSEIEKKNLLMRYRSDKG